MSRKSVAIVVSLLLLLALLPASFAETDTRHAIVLTVSQPVAVPGAVLQPGRYTMRFADDLYRRVVIRSADGNTVGVYPVITASRSEATNDVEIDVLHLGDRARIESWFLPGSRAGWEFVYSGRSSHTLAQTDKAVVAGN